MTTMPSPQKTVLLLIDIQAGFDSTHHWGTTRSNPLFETHASSLLTTYRSTLLPSPHHKIIHIHHSSNHPSSPLHHSLPGIKPASYALPLENELPIYYKSVNSAFIGTPLSELLAEHFGSMGGKLYVAGLTTDHCISTSVRMASNLHAADGRDTEGNVLGGQETTGEVILVEDATAAWGKGGFEAELMHQVHVASLNGEFARVSRTEEVLKEWQDLKSAP